ncbi:hypothetical protein OG474_09855 [Kribbella sp. NBC_01505]|uniref:hypothetical protein n=1 Tax=Kribbella sp. NBC_01505 TaxID=2903580 RepID=UPI00386AF805
MSTVIKNFRDQDSLLVERATAYENKGAVVYIAEMNSGWLTREGAVAIIAAITEVVEAADAREAEAARKLKRGEQVYCDGSPRATRTVVSDETHDGYVDVVVTNGEGLVGHGRLLTRSDASYYTRIP